MDDRKLADIRVENLVQPKPIRESIPPPLPNYTLSTVCPACNAPTHKLACKIRCTRCGFMWDCSEL